MLIDSAGDGFENAGTVDEHVDPPMRVLDFLEKCSHLLLALHIEGEFGSGIRLTRARNSTWNCEAQVGTDDCRPTGAQCLRAGATDTACGATQEAKRDQTAIEKLIERAEVSAARKAMRALEDMPAAMKKRFS